jgi:signal transduction protein with GAF and PtsI domain
MHPAQHDKDFVLLVRQPRIEHFDQLRRCRAVICERGGVNSHPAVLCRIWGKPTLEVEGALELFHEGDAVTLLPNRAEVCFGAISVADPSLAARGQLASRVVEERILFQVSIVDEHDVSRANANPAVAERITQFFVREELLWVKHGHEPFAYLRQFGAQAVIDFLAEQMRRCVDVLQPGQVLNFRSLDMRSDEVPVPGPADAEANPHLGNHGIRRTLREGGPFLGLELQALARLDEARRNRIILSLPFVVEEAEVRESERLIDRLCQCPVRLGVFVETPAAVSELKPILASGRVQMICIGTKDLTQMLLACDRGNASVRHLDSPLKRPVVLAIRSVVSDCRAWDVPVVLFASLEELPVFLKQIPRVDAFSVCCGELLALLDRDGDFQDTEDDVARMWRDLGGGG